MAQQRKRRKIEIEIEEPIKEQKLRNHKEQLAFNERYIVLKRSEGNSTLETVESWYERIKEKIASGSKTFSYTYVVEERLYQEGDMYNDTAEYKLMIDETNGKITKNDQVIWFGTLNAWSFLGVLKSYIQALLYYFAAQRRRLDLEMKNMQVLPSVISNLTKEYMAAGIVVESNESERIYY